MEGLISFPTVFGTLHCFFRTINNLNMSIYFQNDGTYLLLIQFTRFVTFGSFNESSKIIIVLI